MTLKRLAAAFVVLLSAASCARPVPTPSTIAPIPTHGPLASPPPAIGNRAPLPSCGVESAGHDGPWNVAGRACFWNAYLAHRPAEFAGTQLTTEGDPITMIYRVLPDGSIEVLVDSTQDRFAGMRGWVRLACRTLTVVHNAAVSIDFGPDDSCVEVPLSPEPTLSPEPAARWKVDVVNGDQTVIVSITTDRAAWAWQIPTSSSMVLLDRPTSPIEGRIELIGPDCVLFDAAAILPASFTITVNRAGRTPPAYVLDLTPGAGLTGPANTKYEGGCSG